MMKRPSTTMPMPPSQQSSERQTSRPGGASSSPTMTVPPVVVIADTDSNSAWAKSRLSDDSQSGIAPTTENTAHSRLTRTKPNFLEKGGGPMRVAMKVASENPPTMKAEATKICQSGWP
ncbi:hypothetical protein D9M70_535520 [compost metagenome]